MPGFKRAYSLTLSEDIVAHHDTLARRVGLSRSAWINAVLERAKDVNPMPKLDVELKVAPLIEEIHETPEERGDREIRLTSVRALKLAAEDLLKKIEAVPYHEDVNPAWFSRAEWIRSKIFDLNLECHFKREKEFDAEAGAVLKIIEALYETSAKIPYRKQPSKPPPSYGALKILQSL